MNPKILMVAVSKLKIHPSLMQNYELPDEELNQLKADIKARGMMVPIEINEKYEILDGMHRYKIAKELKQTTIRAIKIIFKKDECEGEAMYILQANANRKSLPTHDKWTNWSGVSELFETGRGGIRTKGKKEPSASLDVNHKAAKRLGVSPKTIEKARAYVSIIKQYPAISRKNPSRTLKIYRLIKKHLKNETLSEELLKNIEVLSVELFKEKIPHFKKLESSKEEDINGFSRETIAEKVMEILKQSPNLLKRAFDLEVAKVISAKKMETRKLMKISMSSSGIKKKESAATNSEPVSAMLPSDEVDIENDKQPSMTILPLQKSKAEKVGRQLNKAQQAIDVKLSKAVESLDALSLEYSKDEMTFKVLLSQDEGKEFNDFLEKIPKWENLIAKIKLITDQGGHGYYEVDKKIIKAKYKSIINGGESTREYDFTKHVHQGIAVPSVIVHESL